MQLKCSLSRTLSSVLSRIIAYLSIDTPTTLCLKGSIEWIEKEMQLFYSVSSLTNFAGNKNALKS